MSIRVRIQQAIIELVEAGTFRTISYDGNMPTLGDPYEDTPNIWVNETMASIDDSAAASSRGKEYSIGSWNFECRVKFSKEVDVTEFMLKELSGLRVQDDEFLVTFKTGGYLPDHPPTGGPPSGTKLLFNLTANTRR